MINCPIIQLTDSNKWHFFGYYDRPSFDILGGRVLLHQVSPMNRFPDTGDSAVVGYMEPIPGGEFKPIWETTAWNWQQGASLQWVSRSSTDLVCFNIRRSGSFGSMLIDLDRDDRKVFEWPIFAVRPDGLRGISLNIERLLFSHPTICYSLNKPISTTFERLPDDEGLYEVNLESGDSKLLVSLSEAAEIEFVSSMEDAFHWFSHPVYNPAGYRLLVLHRWSPNPSDQRTWRHRLLAIEIEPLIVDVLGCTDLFTPDYDNQFKATNAVLSAQEKNTTMISHPVWCDNETVLAWSCHMGKQAFHLYHVSTGAVEEFGKGVLIENGHATFSPDGRFLLLDTYPDEQSSLQSLMLYNIESTELFKVGQLYSPELSKTCRCDLHPRWHPQGKQIIFDSMHQGDRQIFSADVSHITSV